MSGTQKTHHQQNVPEYIAPYFLQPQQHRLRPKSGKPRLFAFLLSVLALILAIHFAVVLHATQSAPSFTCLDLLRTTDYTKYVHLQTNIQQMSAVQFISQVTANQPAVLVQVMGTDAQHLLDVYVYGCTMQHHNPALTLVFKQQGLAQGMVSVSQNNTLLLSKLDTSISPPLQALIEPTQQNIYEEYSWHNGAFIQVRFPGLYPVTSRSEAETLQDAFNHGQSLPWNDPLTTAQQLAKDIFQWNDATTQAKVLDNDGTTAHVILIQPQPAFQVTVTLTRLIQHTSTGLWFVTAAQTSGITLDQSALSSATSPLILHGTTSLTDGNMSLTLFDHTLARIHTLPPTTASVRTDGSYRATVSYASIAAQQTGLVLMENMPSPGNAEAGRLLLTSVIFS